MTDRQRHGFVLLLVAGLIVLSLLVIGTRLLGHHKTVLGLDLQGGVELVYQGQPTAQSKVTPAALSRAVDIMRQRVDQLGVSEPQIQTFGGNQISVGLPNVHDTARAESEVGTTARLEFYDWEANLILPSGRTVASLGPAMAQDPNANLLSQGGGSLSPGQPNTGSMKLYDAVKLASTQPVSQSSTNARVGPQYWMFGAPGSAACTAAGKYYGYTPVQGQRCYLVGPDTSLQDVNNTVASLGISKSQGQVLTVPQGTVVIQAIPSNFSKPPKVSDPTTQFFVLKDNVALFGNDISNPQQGTDPSGSPDVNFGFSSKGKNEFQSVTGQIARRGAQVSPLVGNAQPLFQHFAVALDQQLITVPYIDFKQYPDGIPGDTGADISGHFTSQ
jgi:SecD/SecF fusion protein